MDIEHLRKHYERRPFRAFHISMIDVDSITQWKVPPPRERHAAA